MDSGNKLESYHAYRRAEPVTLWRIELSGIVGLVIESIKKNADPETQYMLARETAEDIVEAVKEHLRHNYGRVFDPIIDGPG
jgi:hypothetical protein